ncbi:MAG: DUF4974 domain-containing protein [Prevotellaceae bacterium]|nr:DUF4974 domain-containing protein [Prevotellaceae bacterium]
MNAEQRIERLIELLQQPESSNESELKDLLSDPECRDFYELLSEARRAEAEGESEEALKDVDVDKEWREFKSRRAGGGQRAWRKVAAACVAAVLVSGLAVAAVQVVRTYINDDTQPALEADDAETSVLDTEEGDLTADSISEEMVFCDVELQEVMEALRERYGFSVRYKREEARHVRLYLQVDSAMTLDEVLLVLNHFNNLELSRQDSTVTVN